MKINLKLIFAKSSIFTSIKDGNFISKSVKTIEKPPSIIKLLFSIVKDALTVLLIFFPWKSNSPFNSIESEEIKISSEKNFTLGKFNAFKTLIALESLLLIPLSKSAILADIAILLLISSKKTPFISLLIPDHAWRRCLALY